MAGGSILRLRTETPAGRAPVVVLEGEVDLSTAARLGQACRELRRAGHVEVVLDCSGLTFMDSTGLNACVGLHEELAALGGRLELRSVPPHLTRLLRVAGLDAALVVGDADPDPAP